MSQNMTGRSVEYRVKVGSRATVYVDILDAAGTGKALIGSNNC